METTPKRFARGASIGLIVLLAAILVGTGFVPHGTSPATVAGAPQRVALPSTPSVAARAPHLAPHPTSGRVTTTTESPLPDTAANSLSVVDPTTQEVYSISSAYNDNFASTGNVLTAFNLTTGASLHVPWQLSDPASALPSAMVFAPLQQEIFIAFENLGFNNYTGGYILVVNATTWTLAANLTVGTPTYLITPGYLMYEPLHGQVWVENTYNLTIIEIDPATNAATYWFTTSCSFCYPIGLIDVPSNQTIWVPTETNSLGVINSTTDGWMSAVTWAANPGWYSDIGIEDTDFNVVVISNDSPTGNVEVFWPNGTLVFTETGAGPEYPTAVAFDPFGDVVYFADQNTTFGSGDEIWSYLTFYGALWQQFTNPTALFYGGDYLDSLSVLDLPGVSYLVTGGAGDNSSWLLELNSTYDLGPVLQYPSDSYAWSWQIWIDSTHDRYYIDYEIPQSLVAYNLTTGAQEFTIPTYTGSYSWVYEWFAIDTDQQLIYISVFDTPDIFVFSGTNGTELPTITLTVPIWMISDDPIHHRLYAEDYLDNDTQVIDTLGGVNSVLAPIVATGPSCGIAAIPATGSFADDVCAVTGNYTVEVFNGSSGASFASFSVWPYATELDQDEMTADSAGDLYVPLTPYDLVTVYDTSTRQFVGNWSTGLLSPTAVAADPADGLALVAGAGNDTELMVVNLATGAAESTVRLSSPAASIPDFDNATATFYTPMLYTGQIAKTAVVPLPSVPTGLAGSAGNTTVALSWAAATGPAGYPVTGYDIVWSTAATGPWTAGPSATGTTVTVTGLTDGTKYYFEVEAVGGSGTSASSTAASATPLGVPYPPQSVTLTVGGSTSLSVSWSAPAHTDGAAVSNYSLDWSKGANGPWTVVNVGTGTSYSLTGLSAATAYYVKVVAWNSVGAGNPSATATATTQSSSSGPGGGKNNANGSTSPSGLSSTDLILIVIAVLIVVAALVGLMMMRRRRGGASPPSSPPPQWNPPTSGVPAGAPPPAGPPGVPPGPPPGAQ